MQVTPAVSLGSSHSTLGSFGSNCDLQPTATLVSSTSSLSSSDPNSSVSQGVGASSLKDMIGGSHKKVVNSSVSMAMASTVSAVAPPTLPSAGGVATGSAVAGKGGVNWAFFFSHVRCV